MRAAVLPGEAVAAAAKLDKLAPIARFGALVFGRALLDRHRREGGGDRHEGEQRRPAHAEHRGERRPGVRSEAA